MILYTGVGGMDWVNIFTRNSILWKDPVFQSGASMTNELGPGPSPGHSHPFAHLNVISRAFGQHPPPRYFLMGMGI